MICQVCHEHSAAFERGEGAHRLRMCYHCLSRTGLHLLGGWRLLPVGESPAPCPSCGQSWADFARSGRYGCPSCASSFSSAFTMATGPALSPANRATGNAPVEAAPSLGEELDLNLALLLEDYELAARIRDTLQLNGEEETRQPTARQDPAPWTS